MSTPEQPNHGIDERIAQLENRIEELTARLERFARRDSMHKTLTCPCCGGGSIIRVGEIKEHTHAGLVPLAIGNRATFWTSKTGAPLQAYVCKACLYVEWHAVGLQDLKVDGQIVVELERPDEDAPAPDAPYR